MNPNPKLIHDSSSSSTTRKNQESNKLEKPIRVAWRTVSQRQAVHQETQNLGSAACVAWRHMNCRQAVYGKIQKMKRTREWQGHTLQAFHTMHIYTIKIKTQSGTILTWIFLLKTMLEFPFLC